MCVSLEKDVSVDGDDVFKGPVDLASRLLYRARVPRGHHVCCGMKSAIGRGRPDSYFARCNLCLPTGLVCFNPRSQNDSQLW